MKKEDDRTETTLIPKLQPDSCPYDLSIPENVVRDLRKKLRDFPS